jgi:transcriptional regulator with PAS, ATPase and Fis domain
MSTEDTSMLDKTTLAILKSLPFGVFYCDTELTVRYINQPYADYLGVRPQDVISHKITEFLPETRAPEVMNSGREELFDVISVQRSKTHQRILVNRIPVRNERRQVVGFISQLMSVGNKGWGDIWYKIEYAEKMIRTLRPAAPTDQAGIENDIRESIIGESSQIQRSIGKCLAFGQTEEPVLITGATGVGKELFANAIHHYSHRASGTLVSINCASMSKAFIASELFGYAPGAFTGAIRQGKPGQIELADKGTLFLDEIGDLPLQAQGVLLRVLETQNVQRINANTSNYVDFRLVSATNRDLKALIRSSQFRKDLFYRINTLTLPVPSLAERIEDIPILTQHFLSRFCSGDLQVAAAAMVLLQRYAWPGNVRELRNVTTYAAVHAKYGTIRPEHLPAELVEEALKNQDHVGSAHGEADQHRQGAPDKPDGRRDRQPSPPGESSEKDAHGGDNLAEPPPGHSAHSLASREHNAIIDAIRQKNGNLTQTARLLDISRTTLYEKIKKYRIPR